MFCRCLFDHFGCWSFGVVICCCSVFAFICRFVVVDVYLVVFGCFNCLAFLLVVTVIVGGLVVVFCCVLLIDLKCL